jgi:hypothetical protein
LTLENEMSKVICLAEVAELVDAPDSKSGGGDTMGVRAPPSVPTSFHFEICMHETLVFKLFYVLQAHCKQTLKTHK